MASGFTAAQTGRTHDHARPMLQQPHNPKRTFQLHLLMSAFGVKQTSCGHPRMSAFGPTRTFWLIGVSTATHRYGQAAIALDGAHTLPDMRLRCVG
jgi:hypothetical protein